MRDYWDIGVANFCLTSVAMTAYNVAQVVAPPLTAVTSSGSLGAESTIIAAALVTVIAALVGGVVSVINAVSAAADRRASRVERAALSITTKNTDRKADTIIEKAVEIHTLTNDNLSKVTAALGVANERIQGLEKLMASMLVAQHDAHAARAAATLAEAIALAKDPPALRRTSDAPQKVEVVNVPLETTSEHKP